MVRRNTKLLPKIIILAAFLAILFFLNSRGILEPFKNLLTSIFTQGSTQARSSAVDSKNFFGALFSLGEVQNLEAENERLTLENKTNQEEKQILEKENADLRNQLQLLPRQEFNLINAEVVGQDASSGQELLIINKGEKDGLTAEMPVIISNKILVGKISATEPHRAKVLLSVSPQNTFNAILTKNQVTGVARGRFNLEISLELIPNQTDIQKGDLVATSGKHQNYPAGLLVGEVINITNSPDGLFKEASVKPFYSASTLKFVSVLNINN